MVAVARRTPSHRRDAVWFGVIPAVMPNRGPIVADRTQRRIERRKFLGAVNDLPADHSQNGLDMLNGLVRRREVVG